MLSELKWVEEKKGRGMGQMWVLVKTHVRGEPYRSIGKGSPRLVPVLNDFTR